MLLAKRLVWGCPSRFAVRTSVDESMRPGLACIGPIK